MCLTRFFSLSLPPSLSLFLSRYCSLSLCLSDFCLSVSVPLSLSSFCLSFFLVCLSPSPLSLSFCLIHSFCLSVCLSARLSLSLSLSLWRTHARTHARTHTHTWYIQYHMYWHPSERKGAMPARFVTSSLVTKHAGIAARFVTSSWWQNVQ